MSTTATAPSTEKLGDLAPSVAHMLVNRVTATPDRKAFSFRSGDDWKSLTWKEFGDRVEVVAAGLLSLGVKPEGRVSIASGTRYEWILADLAVMRSGGATTTVYPSTLAEDVAFIVSDSDTTIVIAEDEEQLAKLRTVKQQIPAVEKVVLFEGEGAAEDGDWVITLAELEAQGRALLAKDADVVTKATDAIKPDHLATLIYTSGTTGRPKGVEILHQNWAYEGAATAAIGVLSIDDVQFLWLPMSHSFGKVLLATQLQLGFHTAVDGRLEMIVENLAVIQPTFMAGAPRIFEKIYNRINQMQEAEGGLKKGIFDWAVGVGKRRVEAELAGRSAGLLVDLQFAVADKLVFSKIRARLGGNIKSLVSGSAALSGEVQSWFAAAGLTIYEGYGLTETGAASCITRPDSLAFGTVGQPVAGTEIRIADDGEVLIKGPGVMRGYHNLPEQTEEVFPGDGWFATGDIGEIDDQGRLKITDRKKDLIKTSGGKYIAPSLIESKFKVLCPIASQMVVHALNRNYATALVALDPDALNEWAATQGITGKDYAALTQDPQVVAYVDACVQELNSHLNRWETVKKFEILTEDMTVESGTLTPSLKLRRKVVEQKYSDVLDGMYS